MSDYQGSFRLYDVENVPAYCRGLLDRRLPRMKARLNATQREAALAFLVSTAWELSERYKPGIGTFRGYLSSFLPLRLNDWYRDEFRDDRYHGDEPRAIVDGSNHELLELVDPAAVDDNVADRVAPLPEHVDPRDLTPRSTWILRDIVAPIAEDGESYEDVAVRFGKSRKWTERLLDDLRAELEELAA